MEITKLVKQTPCHVCKELLSPGLVAEVETRFETFARVQGIFLDPVFMRSGEQLQMVHRNCVRKLLSTNWIPVTDDIACRYTLLSADFVRSAWKDYAGTTVLIFHNSRRLGHYPKSEKEDRIRDECGRRIITRSMTRMKMKLLRESSTTTSGGEKEWFIDVGLQRKLAEFGGLYNQKWFAMFASTDKKEEYNIYNQHTGKRFTNMAGAEKHAIELAALDAFSPPSSPSVKEEEELLL
jgi:hypothetical protein